MSRALLDSPTEARLLSNLTCLSSGQQIFGFLGKQIRISHTEVAKQNIKPSFSKFLSGLPKRGQNLLDLTCLHLSSGQQTKELLSKQVIEITLAKLFVCLFIKLGLHFHSVYIKCFLTTLHVFARACR